MDLDLRKRHALVTGSTDGIGFAIAEGFAAEGAAVTLNGRSRERVERAVALLASRAAGAPIDGIAADAATAAGAAAIIAHRPRTDILVNNLGIFETKPFFEIPDSRLAALLRDQRAERRALRAALRAGDARAGLGAHPLRLERERAQHSARDDPLRHDQDGAARGLARPRHRACRHRRHRQRHPAGPDHDRRRRRVARAGGGEGGQAGRRDRGGFLPQRAAELALRRFAAPEEVANLAVYLASPRAAATTGAALRVDGGVVSSIV